MHSVETIATSNSAPPAAGAGPDKPPATHHADPGRPPLPPVRPAQVASRLVIGVVLIGGTLIMGALPRIKQQKKLQTMASTKEHEVHLVNAVHPLSASGTAGVLLPGNVQAVEETVLNARTSGYLRRRFVDIGSRVRTGQVLAEIEAPELDQQLMRARAEASKSRAGREQADADIVKLSANVAQAQSEVARMQSNVETARADLAHSKAKLVQVEGAKQEAIAKLEQVKKRLSGQRANLDRAKSRASLSEKTLKRWRTLEKGGAVSGQELDEKEADFDSAQANVAAAQADVESALADVDAAKHAIESREGDVSAAHADVSAATEKVNAAESSVKSAQSTVEAMQASVQAGRANARAAQATIEASQATVRSYSSMIGFEQIKAPFNGVITARNVDTGALVNAGSGNSAVDPTTTVPRSGLFGIARTDMLRVQVQVPQSMVSMTKPGLRARVLIQEYPGRIFEGIVGKSSGALDASSRTLLTEIRVTNRDGALMPGMYAQVQFLAPQTRSILRIPANTLIVDGAGVRVATVDHDKHIHFRKVTVGRDYGKELEVTEGLVGNELLVTDPTDELTEGLAVRLASETR